MVRDDCNAPAEALASVLPREPWRAALDSGSKMAATANAVFITGASPCVRLSEVCAGAEFSAMWLRYPLAWRSTYGLFLALLGLLAVARARV